MAFTANNASATVSTLGGNVSVTGLGATNYAGGATPASFTFTSSNGAFSSVNVGAGSALFTANKNSGSYGTVTATYTVTDSAGNTTTAGGTITITITASGSYTDVDAVSQTSKTSTNVTITSGTPTRANLLALDARVGTITVTTGSALDLTGTATQLTSIVSAVTFSNKINGTVNDASGLTYSTLNTLLSDAEVNALTVSNQTEYEETAANANSLVALSVASETADKILFKANSQITSKDTSLSNTIIDAIFTDTGGKFVKVILNHNTTLSGALTIPASHTLEVKSGKTLTLGAVLSNSGTLTNGGTIQFNGSSGLTATGATTLGGTVTISGASTFTATGTLAITNAFNVGAFTLTFAGAGALSGGAIQLNSGSSVFKKTGTGSVANALTLSSAGAKLDIDANTTVSGNITMTANATFDIGSNTLTYTGNAINVGANTLTLTGGGSITNSNNINLNATASLIEFAGATVSKLNQGADAASGKGIDVATGASTITTFTSGGQSRIALGANLAITNAFNLGARKMILSGNSSLTGGQITMNSANSLIQVTSACTIANDIAFSANSASGKGLDIDNSCTISGDLSTSSDVIIDLASGATLAYSGAAFAIAANTLNLLGTGTLNNSANAITFTTGTLDVDNSLTISGDITISGSATFDIAAGKTLTYSGDAIDVGANTLSIDGTGTITNSNNINLNNTASLIELVGSTISKINQSADAASGKGIDVATTASTITTFTSGGQSRIKLGANLTITDDFNLGARTMILSGTSTLDGGKISMNNVSSLIQITAACTVGNAIEFTANSATGKGLDITNSCTISGNLTTSANVIIEIDASQTLTYSGAAFAIAANTLNLLGTGTLNNSANAITFTTGTLDVDNDIEIDGAITISGNATIDIANGKTLDYDGASLAIGTNTLKFLGTGTLDNANALTISTGTLDIDNDIEIDGDITISDDATFDIASGKTLNYDGDQIDIGDNALSIIGGGTIDNANNITLSHANSLLNIKTNASATIAKVSTSANVTGTSKGVDIDVNATITTLTVSHTCPVLIKTGVTLSGAVSIKAGKVNLTETGTLGADLAFTGGTSATNCTLDVDDDCTMSGDLSVAGTSTVCILDVANGKTLTYSGAAFALSTYTLQLTGGTGATDEGTLANTNALTFSTGTLDVDNNFEVDGPITISDDAIFDIAANKTLDYDGASIAIGTNTLTIYGAGTIDHANVFTITGGDASAATPTGGEINMKSGSAGADGSGTAEIGDITISGTAKIVKQINRITTKTTNGTIGNITATATDTATNCNTLATDNSDVLTLTINDVATTSIAATVLSSIGNKTSLTPTVSNAIVITGTTTQINAALITAATKVTATTATISDSTHSTTTITGGQYTTAETRGAAANNTGSTIDTNLGITNESTRHQIVDRIFAAKSTMTSFRSLSNQLKLGNSIDKTNTDVYKGTGQTVNLNTSASNVAIYANLSAKNDSIKFSVGTGPNKTTYTVTKTSNTGTSGTNATYTCNGGNANTTHNSGGTKTVGNSPQFVFIFGGVAVNGGAGTAEVTSGGDPYICPTYGPTYKLPDKNAFYRLYENNDIIINGEVKEISDNKKKKIIEYNKKKGMKNTDPIIKDIYLFRSLYVSVGEHKLAFNLEKINWVTTTNSKNFFTISKPVGADLESEWFVGGRDGAACMKIGWMYDNEPMYINLYFFNDPQKENGISLKGLTSIDSLGLFIRNYNPETMKIPNLTHMNSVQEQYDNAKVKFINKPIKGKNEVWLKY